MKERFYYSSSGRIIDCCTAEGFTSCGRVKDSVNWQQISQYIVDLLNTNPENKNQILQQVKGELES